MASILSLLTNTPAISLQESWLGWVVWLVCLAFCLRWAFVFRKSKLVPEGQLAAQNKHTSLGRGGWVLLTCLFVFSFFSAVLIGVELPGGSALPAPGIPIAPRSPTLMVFSAVPWMLAGGLFGPLAGLVAGLLSGLASAIWDTHSIYSVLESGLFALAFSSMIHQRFRTRFFTWLRRPVVASLLLACAYPFVSLVLNLIATPGNLASRVDYSLSRLGWESLGMAVELLVAGLFAEAVAYAAQQNWGSSGPLIASPAERSLQTRFLYSLTPVALFLIIILVVSDWVVAGQSAQNMFRERMRTAAELAAAGIPYYLETGQNLITYLSSDPRLLEPQNEDLRLVLANLQISVAFFDQLYLFDENGRLLAGHPAERYPARQSPQEEASIQLALTQGVNQYITMRGLAEDATAQVSFVSAVLDEEGEPRRALVGRSSLANNPFMLPALFSLEALAGEDGEGIIVDDDHMILVHPDPAVVMTEYSGELDSEPRFTITTSPNGTRRLVYSQPANSRDWSIVLSVPARRSQEMAIEIAMPLLGVIVILALLSYVILRIGVHMVTASLGNLASEAGQIAEGNLDRGLPVDGEDEVGHLRRAFEGMRLSLKARLGELNRLLVVSQGVASSLELEQAVRPLLEAALAHGACAARIVLTPALLPELDGRLAAPSSFGFGPCSERFVFLEEQILAITRQQERLALSSLLRPRLFRIPAGAQPPEALLAIALNQDNQYYGALWVAYDRSHNFRDEEVRFMTTLASHASLAVMNSQLFLNAEIGRQRLAAILASSPDPVLVTDQNDRLLLANPAAWQALDLGMEKGEGQSVEKLIADEQLVRLLRGRQEGQSTIEIKLPGGQIYLATASSVLAEGQQVGRVCVLRDITHFKELDALKSEFVSTVSHDLRSPLTLMRGYATMLEMVGQLNEQQTGYVRKIVSGVENMTRLVNNLLDLGRIEAGVGLQPETVLVQDVVERVYGALQIQATQKRINFTYEIVPGTALMLQADQALLGQALHNLLENAIKYTRPEGKVQLRVYSRNEKITFEVSDNGIGIAPVDQVRLFEKFYRGGNQAAREQAGTGLGLAIVKSIAERHGGSVNMESQLGKGSSFYLTVPLRQRKN